MVLATAVREQGRSESAFLQDTLLTNMAPPPPAAWPEKRTAGKKNQKKLAAEHTRTHTHVLIRKSTSPSCLPAVLSPVLSRVCLPPVPPGLCVLSL